MTSRDEALRALENEMREQALHPYSAQTCHSNTITRWADRLAILATASEQAPVAWLEAEPGTKLTELHNPDWPVGFARSTIMHMAMREPVKRQPDNVLFPLYSSPAHTSEAMDAARYQFIRDAENHAEDMVAKWAGKDLDDVLDAAMRQEAGSRE